MPPDSQSTIAAASALGRLDGLAQAELVAHGELSASELLDAAIARSDQVNPAINALVLPMFDEARKVSRADLPSGAFQGLPFLLKDAFATYAGQPTSNGSRLFAGRAAAHDSHLVTRFKQSGVVELGKTNTPEFGSLCPTEPALFGPTRTPWNTEHSAGGSSGGSAAAVAARIVPMAHASDGAGSIRIPASCCGLVGLKTSRGRISHAPGLGENIGGMMAEGVVSLSVRDTAAMTDACAGPAPGDPYAAPPFVRPLMAAMRAAPHRLTIALTRHSLLPTELHPDCVLAVDHAARLCRDLGHEVIEDRPPLDGEEYVRRYSRFWPMSATRTLRREIQASGSEDCLEQVEAFNRFLYEVGSRQSAADYVLDLEWFQATTRAFANWFESRRYDLWLTPTLGMPPPRLGYFDADVLGGAEVLRRFIAFLPFTTFNNMMGTPGITLPLHWNSDGLPVGTHFTARYGDEETLVQLAVQLESAHPWIDRLPPICA